MTSKKTVLRDFQNEHRKTMPKFTGSSSISKGVEATIEAVKVPGNRRPALESLTTLPHPGSSDNNAANGHLVYVRRRPEVELGKGCTFDNTKSRTLDDNYEITEQKSQGQETKICSAEVSQMWRASLLCFASGKPSVTSSVEKSCNIYSAAVSNFPPVSSAMLPLDYPTRTNNNQNWQERYCQLQEFLKMLDQAHQEEYIQVLQYESSVDLSRHAVELEKRSIQLSLEEAKEMQRVRLLDVLGIYSKNSKVPSTQPGSQRSEGTR